mmetsp:Transcript_59764/g.146717  ORF Transcript_59764/g.146717 Transcript_59764/m.146717 type:complete len:524 (+) Transcript_59764:390-1961(+)
MNHYVGDGSIEDKKCDKNTSSQNDDNNPNINGIPMDYDNLDVSQVDHMLAEQMMTLSFNDRNEINEEVHGVRCLTPDETPYLVQRSLEELSAEIDKTTSKPAFDYARDVLQSPYIYDEGLRLRCLRSELFNPTKGARRFVGFLDLLWDYYGDDGLMRPIKMSDLNKEETDQLKTGEYQILPFRDRSGRRVLATIGDAGLNSTLHTRMKLLIYLLFVMAEDIETQRRGVIVLFSPNFDSGLKFPHKDEITQSQRVTGITPTRQVAMHQCTPDEPVFRLIHAGMQLALSFEARLRAKFHQGSPLEVKYKLLAFGIPVDLIPITESGKVKTKYHQQWIKIRRAKEEMNEIGLVECPNLNDVAFRFGKSYLSHQGNSYYRGLLEQHYQYHNSASTSDQKVEVSWTIIKNVERRGGRFLAWDNSNGCWTVLTDRNQIRSKVATSLKEQKKKNTFHSNNNNNNQQQKQPASTLISQSATTDTGSSNNDNNNNSRGMDEPNSYQFERQDGRKRKRDEYGAETNTFACFQT